MLALVVTSAGQAVMIGFWVSRTITLCWQVVVLPLLSVTVHVTVLVPTGNCAGALLVIVTEPQLSVAVTVPKVTPVAKHEPVLALVVTSAGHEVITGT